MIDAGSSAIVRSVSSGQFSRKNNFLVNYLVSNINTLNVRGHAFGVQPAGDIPKIGITSVNLTE
jgi:hypothetical protein